MSLRGEDTEVRGVIELKNLFEADRHCDSSALLAEGHMRKLPDSARAHTHVHKHSHTLTLTHTVGIGMQISQLRKKTAENEEGKEKPI